MGAQIYKKKSKNRLKILGPRMVTQSKYHVKWFFMWSDFILKWSEVSYGKILGGKRSSWI